MGWDLVCDTGSRIFSISNSKWQTEGALDRSKGRKEGRRGDGREIGRPALIASGLLTAHPQIRTKLLARRWAGEEQAWAAFPKQAQRCRNDPTYRLGHHLLVPETLSPLWKGKKIPLPFFFLSLCTETSFILDPNPLPLPPVSTGKVIVPPPPCNLEGYEIVTIV